LRGHQKMIIWQNIDKLDIIVQEVLHYIPKREFKMRSQIDNASDSVGSNFVEGYYSGSLAEYIRKPNKPNKPEKLNKQKKPDS